MPLLLAGVLGAAGAGAETITRDQLSTLLADCNRARQEKLTVAQDAQIKACVERGWQLDYCEHRYEHYGERIERPNTTNVVGLFWDLPICEKAIAAERYFAIHPAKQTFEYIP